MMKNEIKQLHRKILAGIYLFFGGLLALVLVVTHLLFVKGLFSNAGSVMFDFGSLFDFASISEKYAAYFDGVSPLKTLVFVVLSILFGYGLLQRKDWAKLLGFFMAIVSLFVQFWSLTNGFINTGAITEIVLAAYTIWVLFLLKTEESRAAEIF